MDKLERMNMAELYERTGTARLIIDYSNLPRLSTFSMDGVVWQQDKPIGRWWIESAARMSGSNCLAPKGRIRPDRAFDAARLQETMKRLSAHREDVLLPRWRKVFDETFDAVGEKGVVIWPEWEDNSERHFTLSRDLNSIGNRERSCQVRHVHVPTPEDGLERLSRILEMDKLIEKQGTHIGRFVRVYDRLEAHWMMFASVRLALTRALERVLPNWTDHTGKELACVKVRESSYYFLSEGGSGWRLINEQADRQILHINWEAQ